jgi:hypothetical protein
MGCEADWQAGVARVTEALSHLGGPELERLRALVRVMMEQKRAIHALSAAVDPAVHCAACGGACCVRGRYHFTAVDLLVYLATGERLFTPQFQNGLCPYLAQHRCLMPPQLRPFNCITFNCERIEDLLPPQAVVRFYELERELRGTYQEMRSLFPDGSANGAVLTH